MFNNKNNNIKKLNYFPKSVVFVVENKTFGCKIVNLLGLMKNGAIHCPRKSEFLHDRLRPQKQPPNVGILGLESSQLSMAALFINVMTYDTVY